LLFEKVIIANWVINNPEYLKEHKTDEEALLIRMCEDLSWEFPTTYLESLNY